MRRKIFLTLVLILLALPQAASAQLGRWDVEEEGAFKDDIRSGHFRPFIEANWGIAQPRFEGLGSSFSTVGMVELKLGFTALDSVRRGISSLDDRYAFGTYFSEDVHPGSPDAGDIRSKLGRFGVGNRLGYGYGGKLLTVELYNQNSMNWTSIEALDYGGLNAESQAVFDRYGTTLRYGQLYEAGVKVHVFRSLGLTAGVEGAVIYPRTVFWPALGSAAIYSAVQGGLQFFSEQIVESSPVLGPLIHFALKSGVSLAYYMMQRDDMNWPFDSETPLTMESAKLGATITF